jgi:hypothetical protein
VLLLWLIWAREFPPQQEQLVLASEEGSRRENV